MRRLYDEFFYIPQHGKVREKVMLTRVIMTVSIIIMCLLAMSITAYAYFSYDITSGSNTVKAANFEITVQIADQKGDPVEVIAMNDKSYTAQLKTNMEYSITLLSTKLSTAKTGFVIITAENCNSRYHTQQISKEDNTELTFSLKPNADTKVTFLSHWGTSSYYDGFMEVRDNNPLYIINGERVELSIEGAVVKKPNNKKPASSVDNSGSKEDASETTPTNTTSPVTSDAATNSTENTSKETALPSQTIPPSQSILSATTQALPNPPSEETEALEEEDEKEEEVTPPEPAVEEEQVPSATGVVGTEKEQ